jgi:hypothetical protein
MTHDDLLETLRNDIATHSMLEQRRQAVETYAIFMDCVIKFDSAYEEEPEPAISEDEVQQMWVMSCSK